LGLGLVIDVSWAFSFKCVANAIIILMWVLVPTDEVLFFVRIINMDVVNAENAGTQSTKEKYPKETRSMPLASCASRIYQGFSKGNSCPSSNTQASLLQPLTGYS
jgi:hypothetical protein